MIDSFEKKYDTPVIGLRNHFWIDGIIIKGGGGKGQIVPLLKNFGENFGIFGKSVPSLGSDPI